jgi:hypothetical protein
MVITGDPDHFAVYDGKVNSSAVKELLAAMDAPPVESPSLSDCGIGAWLEANYTRGLQDYTHRKLRSFSPEQIDLFKTDFASEGAFDALFAGFHTDDYPKLSVTVVKGGQEFGVTSDSQNPFMLPWFGTDRVRGGYSCRLSRAIFAVLPKDFTNRDRLVAGDEFRGELAGQVMSRLYVDWRALDAQHLVGPEIAPILAHFHPIQSEVSGLNSIDLDGREAWNAMLTTQDLPANLHIGVSLLYTGKHLEGVDTFIRRVPAYTGLVVSVPWLRKYLDTVSGSTFELRYVDGESLSPLATKSLAGDLRANGKSALAERVERDAANSAFLEIDSGNGCWSRILVFPDKETLLWHFKCDSVLGFSAKQFTTWDYLGWRSTGTLIDSDGRIEK